MAVTSSENPVVDKENDVPSGTEHSLKAAAANTSSPDDVRFQMTSVNEEKKNGSKKGTIVKFIIVAFLSMAVGAVGAIFIYREIVGNAEHSPRTATPSASGQNEELSGDEQFAGGIELPPPPPLPPNDRQEATTSTSNGDDPPPPPLLDGGNFGGLLIPTLQGEDEQFAGGIELPPPPPLPPNDRQEATTSTSNGDDPPPPPLLDGGNFGGLWLPTLPGEDPAVPPFLLGGNFVPSDSDDSMPTGVIEEHFVPSDSDDSMPTGVIEEIGHHSFQNRRGPLKVDYTQISCNFETPCEWFRMQDWTVQNKTIGNVSDLGVYYSGNYLLFQYDLPGVSTLVTNDVVVSKFNAVFCLSFMYYLPGPSGVLYVQIVDSNTADIREAFSERNFSNVWRKSKVTITTSNDFVILLEVENMLNDSIIAIDNVVLTNETCIYTQESESNHSSSTVKTVIPAAL